MIGGRLHRGATLALFLAAAVATAVHWHDHLGQVKPRCAPPSFSETTLAEVLWYGCGALLLLSVPRILEVRTRMTRAQAWALALGIGGMAFAQVAGRAELTFPFVRWNMFSRAPEPVAAVT